MRNRSSVTFPSRFFAFLLVLSFGAVTMWAQGGATGAISGTVRDQSSGGVPRAHLDLAGEAGTVRHLESDASGEFAMPPLPVGTYTLVITALAILMLHSDCGAYGGLAGGFDGSARAEAEHHEAELRRDAECVSAAVPGIAVQAYFVDFEVIWEVELAPHAMTPKVRR